ncbi:MAG: hypothetical protein NWQ13_00845 [Glaciimonas sp.]|nr:hypothetical protein [Glaciimonas sp.]
MITTPVTTMAQTTNTAKKVVKKKVVKKAAKPAAAAAAVASLDDDEDEGTPDIKTAAVIDYKCEVGSNLTIYRNAEDPKHITLKVKTETTTKVGKKMVVKEIDIIRRLTAVSTTTGANRYENKKYGLVWIGIPSKGMLLNSKLGKQISNDCTSSEQHSAEAAPVPAQG